MLWRDDGFAVWFFSLTQGSIAVAFGQLLYGSVFTGCLFWRCFLSGRLLRYEALTHVELCFMNGVGFQRMLNTLPDGSFGYINMQFGDIEMHRNKNWEMLISMPNDPIR